MLTELRIENFQGFRGQHQAALRRLTLIFGPNSSGKSALVRALALLRQSTGITQVEYSGPLLFRGSLVDLGDFRSVVNGHDTRLSVGLGITHTAKQQGSDDDIDSLLSFDLKMKWNGIAQAPWLDQVLYYLPRDRTRDVLFRRIPTANSEERAFLKVAPSESLRKVTDHLSQSAFERGRRISSHLKGGSLPSEKARDSSPARHRRLTYEAVRDTRLSVYAFLPTLDRPVIPDNRGSGDFERYEALLQWGSSLQHRRNETLSALKAIAYLGPLRMAPRRFEPAPDAQPGYVGPSGEGTAQLLNVQPDLLESLNGWMQQLEIPYTLQVRRVSTRSNPTLGELLAIELRDSRTGSVVSPSDVGFGISQVLPLVTQALLCRNGTMLVEQPEIHLHPRLQARLGSLFAEVILANDGSQIIAETHSELLMLRIQRLIASGQLSPSDVQVLYVGAGSDGSWLTELPLNERGRFEDEWPQGFFEERYEEWSV